MSKFTIPTIFAAIDRFTGPVNKMSDSMSKFEQKVNNVGANAKKVARTSAMIGLAIAAPLAIAANSAIKYEKELANLQALTGQSGAQFESYKTQIEAVANATGKGFTETAQAFTAIANNQPELVKSAEALGAVTKATITLAKASQMELQPAGESLTQILNQFGLGAESAEKAIHILAAGSIAGSSEIMDSAEAIQKFGTVAANAGVKLDESIAMIELVSKFDKGAEAGTKLRNILIKMGNIKVLPKDAQKDIAKAGINMGIVSDATLPLATRLKEVSKILNVQSGVTHVFEAENQALATGLLTNVDLFGGYLSKVNTAGAANEMAATATNTLANRMAVLQTKTDNVSIKVGEALIPVLDKLADKIIPLLTSFTDWAKGNSDTITTVVKLAVAIAGLSFAISAISTMVVLVTKGIIAYNFVIGVMTGLNILASESIWTNVAAQKGFVLATKLSAAWTQGVTAATWLWNAALLANPVALVVVGVLALVAALGYVISNYESIADLHKKSMGKSSSQAFEDETKQIEFATKAYEKYGKSHEQAQKLAIRDSEQNLALQKADLAKKMSGPVDEKTLMQYELEQADLEGKQKAIQAVNPQATQQESMQQMFQSQTNNASVDLNLAPQLVGKSSSPFVNIKTTSTSGF